jgi:hypothetical protein
MVRRVGALSYKVRSRGFARFRSAALTLFSSVACVRNYGSSLSEFVRVCAAVLAAKLGVFEVSVSFGT